MSRLDPARPKVPDLAPLIRAVYESPNGGAGCCLHIVTDDGNYQRSSVELCLRFAHEAQHPTCIAAAEMMLKMSRTQIAKACKPR